MAEPPLPAGDAGDDSGDQEVATRKAVLRAQVRALRGALAPVDRAAASAQICAHLQVLAADRGARRIGVYAATPTEVDVGAAALTWVAAGLVVAYPRVEGPGAMTFRTMTAIPETAGRFGLQEPPEGAPVAEGLDLLVVPGVAFDREGGRLGQGGGFYDRWLGQAGGPFALGVCFAAQLVPAVPRALHDVAVDAVLTEDGMYR